VACALIGFLVVLAIRAPGTDPEARLPERFRLAGLIEREQDVLVGLRRDTERLRAQVEQARRAAAARRVGAAEGDAAVARASLVAGLRAVRGEGLRVVLDDAPPDRRRDPAGDVHVNDLVVHSEDVQAALNALWRAGAEAVAINGERVVATSGVLCVGNTLLLNGTVHSPPYALVAVGAVRDRFDDDPLVGRLHRDAEAFGLRFTVEHGDELRVPAYDGAAALRFASAVR
jgi:uncharacterized protein YlxW (UPF0749 family)